MSCISFYADQDDFDKLLTWLNAETDIAWLISDGPKRWKAVATYNAPGNGVYCLWHIPSGDLPLLLPAPHRRFSDAPANSSPSMVVEDPWSGWEEKRTGADPSQPYFGDGHPGIIWLEAGVRGSDGPDAIGMSSFGWIGNHYSLIGNGAPEVTSKWWRRLSRRVKKGATRIPRQGPLDGPNPEIWAHPSAMIRIKNGAIRDLNPA